MFWDICPKKTDKKKIWTMSKLLDIHEDFLTISSLCVSKWLDIHKDFWTISKNKMFYFSHIVYINSIT